MEPIVMRRPITKQELCKQATDQQLILGNNSADTVFQTKREYPIMEETFSVRLASELYNEN
jgi:hypothetical protein